MTTFAETNLDSGLITLANKAKAQQHKVSNRYAFVDSQDLLETIIQVIPDSANVVLHAPRPTVKSTKHMFEVRLDDHRIDLFGTEVVPRVLVWNSYLGECQLQGSVGVFRFVCANGLVLGDQFFSMTARHTQGSTLREKIAAFRDELGRAVAYITSPAFAVDTVARTERKVETAKALDIVRGLKIPETARLKTTFQLVHQDLMREEDRGGRVFDLYNLVNENIRMSVESSLAAERANIGLLESIVQAAA